MAGASLLTLLDDIAALLDDVSILTRVAAKKTAGVLGDDLALNAQQVAGVRAHRELPVVWAVFKGSLLNKAILVPAALAISLWLPWAIVPLMLLGGGYLCFEGAEKIWHRIQHPPKKKADAEAAAEAQLAAGATPEAVADAAATAPQLEADIAALEKTKIRGAVRTDFILSAEIIVISLGVVAGQPLLNQLAVLVAIALGMTLGVYGLVAGIVKIDDFGLWLSKKASAAARALGRGLLWMAPWLMKVLSVVGTAAMFLVGGGIFVHSIPALHHVVEPWMAGGGLKGFLVENGANFVVGVVVGVVVVLAVTAVRKMLGRHDTAKAH